MIEYFLPTKLNKKHISIQHVLFIFSNSKTVFIFYTGTFCLTKIASCILHYSKSKRDYYNHADFQFWLSLEISALKTESEKGVCVGWQCVTAELVSLKISEISSLFEQYY